MGCGCAERREELKRRAEIFKQERANGKTVAQAAIIAAKAAKKETTK